MTLEPVIETPGRYVLRVGWDTPEDHMATFRSSTGSAQWRAEVGEFFIATPDVVHVRPSAIGF